MAILARLISAANPDATPGSHIVQLPESIFQRIITQSRAQRMNAAADFLVDLLSSGGRTL